VFFDWSVYSGDSDTEEVSLLLSVRSQQLILSAMDYLDKRGNWLEVDDATYDDIDAAVAEAFEEMMRPVMPDFTPVGMISWFMTLSANIPDKWLKCDGTVYNQVDYPDLYSSFVGTAYRISGSTFSVPDLRDKFLYGTSIDAFLNNQGGSNVHTLTVAEMPAHTHIQRGRNVTGGANNQNAIAVGTDTTQLNTITTTGSAGSGDAHNNMPPYIRGYFCIKALP
jgi:microcystin-dependent protein